MFASVLAVDIVLASIVTLVARGIKLGKERGYRARSDTRVRSDARVLCVLFIKLATLSTFIFFKFL